MWNLSRSIKDPYINGERIRGYENDTQGTPVAVLCRFHKLSGTSVVAARVIWDDLDGVRFSGTRLPE